MKKFPNINLPATDKQRRYLKRLSGTDYSEIQINKYDAFNKIQSLLIDRGNPNIKQKKSPKLIDFLTKDKFVPLISQLGALSNQLQHIKYDNAYIDSLFGVVEIQMKSDSDIKIMMEIEDAKDYSEIILHKALDKYFQTKYPLGVIFIQNQEYLVALYTLFQQYYNTYHPSIEFNISIN